MDGKMCGCSCEQCKGGVCHGNACGGCMHTNGHNWLLRLILGLFILFIVFKVGEAVGEFRSEFGPGYNYRTGQGMMGSYSGANAYDASSIGNINF